LQNASVKGARLCRALGKRILKDISLYGTEKEGEDPEVEDSTDAITFLLCASQPEHVKEFLARQAKVVDSLLGVLQLVPRIGLRPEDGPAGWWWNRSATRAMKTFNALSKADDACETLRENEKLVRELAARSDDVRCRRALLRICFAHDDESWMDPRVRTSLHYVCSHAYFHHATVVAALIRISPRTLLQRNKAGHTPLDLARIGNFKVNTTSIPGIMYVPSANACLTPARRRSSRSSSGAPRTPSRATRSSTSSGTPPDRRSPPPGAA
jgi:hypothetical protein